MKGIVSQKFDPQLGYGFVKCDDGREAFIHASEVVDGTKLRPQIRIEFDLERSPDGRGRIVATNISSTGREAARQEKRGTQRGWIRTFSGSFGFVKPEGGGKSLFFHATPALLEHGAAVAGGLPVEFETGRGPTGRPEAINVRRIASEHQTDKEQETECRQEK